MDLTEYSPLFIFIMIVVTIMCGCIAYAVLEQGGIAITVVLFFIGVMIALAIINANEYRDASPETVTTLLVGSLSFNCVYCIFNLIEIFKQKQYQMQQKREAERRSMKKIPFWRHVISQQVTY